ncbi:MAG: hypothetical protein AAF747_04805, partial [Planctomycetota bacterium]
MAARPVVWIVLVMWAIGLTPWVCAQQDLLGPGVAEDAGIDENRPVGEIDVSIRQFGLAGVIRYGSWVGVEAVLADRSSGPRDVLVRLSVPDADGDTTAYEAVVSTNPGIPQPVWLYPRLPFAAAAVEDIELAVFEVDSNGNAGDLLGGPVLPRLANQLGADIGGGAILTIGSARTSLLAYSTIGSERRSAQGRGAVVIANEPTAVRTVESPSGLPDRWIGLSPFSVVAWVGGQPSDLSIQQVRALSEWVQRGGHLVISLPSVGTAWTTLIGEQERTASTGLLNRELAQLLPAVSVERLEGVSLEPAWPLLSDDALQPVPRIGTLHTLTPRADALPSDAVVVLADGEGRPLVTRRVVGLGMVTLAGIDVSSAAFAGRLPRVDVFWNRVLGKRSDVYTAEELDTINTLGDSSVSIDRDFGEITKQTGAAYAGLLLGVVVFAIYWVVAGPGGYAGLKKASIVKHAWLAFVLAGAVFTAVSWVGAFVLRPKSVQLSHLSYYDQVWGQGLQRSTTFGSLLVPDNGVGAVRVGTQEELVAEGRARFIHLAGPWETPSTSAVGVGGFPDSRPYSVEARQPDGIAFPARSTSKGVAMAWIGGSGFGRIQPTPSAASNRSEITIVERDRGAGFRPEGRL